jgi:transposase-like protein
MSGERQVPFFCPYCGEENLRPAGADDGNWECRSCARGFSLKFVSVIRPLPRDRGGRSTPSSSMRSAS